MSVCGCRQRGGGGGRQGSGTFWGWRYPVHVVAGHAVRRLEHGVEIVRVPPVPNEGKDGDPDIGLEAVALPERHLGLSRGPRCNQGLEEQRRRESTAHNHVVPAVEPCVESAADDEAEASDPDAGPLQPQVLDSFLREVAAGHCVDGATTVKHPCGDEKSVYFINIVDHAHVYRFQLSLLPIREPYLTPEVPYLVPVRVFLPRQEEAEPDDTPENSRKIRHHGLRGAVGEESGEGLHGLNFKRGAGGLGGSGVDNPDPTPSATGLRGLPPPAVVSLEVDRLISKTWLVVV